MDYVRLGSTGAKVSRLCLGCMSFGAGLDWMLPEAPSREIIRKAIGAGINFFDTADIYSDGASEEILGRALRDFGPPREEAVIATKVGLPMAASPNRAGLSRKHIMQSIDASLKRLGTDYVDLYQIHRFDYATPIEETVEALNDVVRAGKALYIGASAMFAWQLAHYLHLAERMGAARFIGMQNHYNLLYREEEREMLPLCENEGIAVLPYMPLAGGVLARESSADSVRANSSGMSRSPYTRPSDHDVVNTVRAIAQERGVSRATVGFAWLLSRSAVTAPIVGPTRAEHLDAPLAALSFSLSDEEMQRLEAPYEPRNVIGAMRPGDIAPNARK